MISVVIPVFNEEGSIAELHTELLAVLRKTSRQFEIIFVDDGSTDGTVSELKKLSHARTIVLARHFGKSQALQAGFDEANGEYVFTMDGDLQDDPNEIPNFLREMKESDSDLVVGWKHHRLDGFAKNIVSKIANSVTRFFTGTSVHDMNCGFKLYRREAAKSLNLYGDMHRYIPALLSAQGFRITELSVNHRERKFGVSKYGNFRRFFKSFFDFITLILLRSFVDRPMHIFGIIGSAFSFAGTVILVYLAYLKLFLGEAIGSRPLLLLGILLVVIGIQLFSSGFLGELIIRQNGGRRVYSIREQFNHGDR